MGKITVGLWIGTLTTIAAVVLTGAWTFDPRLAFDLPPDAFQFSLGFLLGLGTASDELLLEAKRQADAAGTVVNLHQSYSPADVEADRARFGKDPMVNLAEIGFLDRNITMAHTNHLSDAECEVILERGTSLAKAPAASMLWGHGGCIRGRHAELWRRGANVCLGSDSGNWSNDFDIFKQASLAALTAVLERAEKEGLVHTSTNTADKPSFLRNCCQCCCSILKGRTKLGIASAFAPSGFLAEVESEECTGCGICADGRCPMGAIGMKEDVAVVEAGKCIGCGLCVTACPVEAIALFRPDDVPEIPATTQEILGKILTEKGKLQTFSKLMKT